MIKFFKKRFLRKEEGRDGAFGRGYRQRKDRGLSARHRSDSREKPPGNLSRSGNLAHPPDLSLGKGEIWQAGGGTPFTIA